MAEPRLTVVKLPSTSSSSPEPGAEPAEPPESLFESVRRELAQAGRESTPLGMAALTLAGRLPTAEDASKLAALTKEFRATYAAALEGAAQVEDELDLIRRRYGRGAGA